MFDDRPYEFNISGLKTAAKVSVHQKKLRPVRSALEKSKTKWGVIVALVGVHA